MRSIASFVAALIVLIGIRVAHADFVARAEGADGERYETRFEDPEVYTFPGTCSWQVSWNATRADLDWRKKSGPGMTSHRSLVWGVVPFPGWYPVRFTSGWAASSLHHLGQLFQAAVAYDDENLVSASGSHVHTNDDWLRMRKTDSTACIHLAGGAAKPKFTMKGKVVDGAGGTTERIEQHARVIESAPEIGLQADLTCHLDVTDGGSSGFLIQAGQGGSHLQLPIPQSSGTERAWSAVHPLVWKVAIADEVNVTFQHTTDVVSMLADGWTQWPVQDESHVEGFVFDSLAGLRLEATCETAFERPSEPTPACTGAKIVRVSWY